MKSIRSLCLKHESWPMQCSLINELIVRAVWILLCQDGKGEGGGEKGGPGRRERKRERKGKRERLHSKQFTFVVSQESRL